MGQGPWDGTDALGGVVVSPFPTRQNRHEDDNEAPSKQARQ
jgi:hypothetical protein